MHDLVEECLYVYCVFAYHGKNIRALLLCINSATHLLKGGSGPGRQTGKEAAVQR